MEEKKEKVKAFKVRSSKKDFSRKISLISERDIALDFVQKVHEKFDKLIKASILFGSQAKKTAQSNSDIDIIIIIDDAAVSWDLELIAWYREELGKIISSNTVLNKRELHVNTVKLTTWWQDLMYGDPVVINILRYGEALIDVGGFFEPLKALLQQGKIKSTSEAIYAALQRAPTHLARSKLALLSSVEGIYWTMIDSAQAALMTAGKLPPSPEHIPELLKEEFVDSGMLKMDYVMNLKNVYILHKAIAHKEILHFRGIDIDDWQNKAEKFLSEMTRIISYYLDMKKK